MDKLQLTDILQELDVNKIQMNVLQILALTTESASMDQTVIYVTAHLGSPVSGVKLTSMSATPTHA